MDLPTPVRTQAERANELLAQLNGAPAQAPAEPPADPATPEPENPEQAPPVEPAAPPAEPPAAPIPPAKDESAAMWEHKYRTLQGVIEANERNWRGEKQKLNERIQQLEQQPPAPAPETPLVTDKDVETYGPELMDVIGRKAQDIAQQIVAQRMQELQPVLEQTRNQAGQAAAQVYQSAQDKFYADLAAQVHDWRTVDNDTRWHAWLGEVDPLSGVQRQAYLNNAVQAMDVDRTARLFGAFKQAAGLAQPSAQPAAPAPASPPQSPSPRSVGTATAPMPREPNVAVKRSEISAHYKRSSMDHSYRTTEAYREMEQRISTATAMGQIVDG